jgi:hypothetical protein
MGSGSGGREPTRFFPAGPQLRYRYRYAAAAKTGGATRARRWGGHQRWQRPAASGKVGAGVAAEQHGPPPLGRAGAACAGSAA